MNAVRPSNCMFKSERIKILLKDALDVALVNGDLEREAVHNALFGTVPSSLGSFVPDVEVPLALS